MDKDDTLIPCVCETHTTENMNDLTGNSEQNFDRIYPSDNDNNENKYESGVQKQQGTKRHIDFTKFPFHEAFQLLVYEIESVRKSLGADGNDQTRVLTNTQSNTTMENPSTYSENVLAWNTDDVMKWLKREQLEIFQDALTGFTGATLREFYEIKLESPLDFYRSIESLLLPNIPRRLFYNLTFKAALKSLFSSPN